MRESYSHQSIENLKAEIDIVEVISNAIQLKRTGANYKACCPFHGEKTPSFVVSPDKQIFKCFGCGVSGDAIEFVKKYYNLEFIEAIEKIAKDKGFTLEKTAYDDSRDIYYKANKDAARYFVKSLITKPNEGMRYLSDSRKMNMDTITRFGLGYADNKWDSLYNHMSAIGYDDETLLELGLISINKGKKYDRFRNRVMFPIISTNGRVIGFGGRTLDNKGAKYINSPENPVFHKSNNLFSLNFAREHLRKSDFLIVVEGYMDVIGLYQSGICNVVATLGTALTENHGKILKRYAKKVVLSYDSDNAGRNAAYKGVDILRDVGVSVSVLHVDDGKDPDDYVKAHGKEEFLNLVSNAISGTDYQLRHIARNFDLTTVDGKIGYIKALSLVFQKLSPVEREVYAQKVGRSLDLDYKNILFQVEEQKVHEQNRNLAKDTDVKYRNFSQTEKVLFKVFFMDSSYFFKFKENKSANDVVTTEIGREVLKLIENEINLSDGFLDEKRIKDAMNPEEGYKLDEIISGVPILDIKASFDDCIRNAKLARLLSEVNKILDIIALADEEEEGREAERLQVKLMNIQRDIKKLKGGVDL